MQKHEYSSTQEWKDDVDAHQHAAQLGTLNLDAAESMVRKCPVYSEHQKEILFHLEQAKRHVREHNKLMHKIANSMKLESFKRERIKDYGI